MLWCDVVAVVEVIFFAIVVVRRDLVVVLLTVRVGLLHLMKLLFKL